MDANVKKGKVWIDENNKEYVITKVFGAYSTFGNFCSDKVTKYVGMKPKDFKWPFQLSVAELLENYKPTV